jgi:hypothetical protein
MREFRRPSPSMVVAVIALFVALAGTAVAGGVLNKKGVNKIITKRAPGLSVSHAKTADNATNADKLAGQGASAFASSQVEPFREVGSAGQPPFQNGWHNDAVTETTAAFYKDPFGIVHLKGIVTGGATGTTIFTLPSDYRPTKSGCFGGLLNEYDCVVSDGDVNLVVGSGTTSLDGITFRAGTG